MNRKKFKTIRSKITLITILLCVFLSIIVSAASYSFYYQTIRQNMIRAAESSLTLLGSSIDNNIQNVYSFVRNCQTSTTIQDYLQSTETSVSKIAASTYLKDRYNSYNERYYIKRIFIASYSRNDFLQISGSTYNKAFHSAENVMELPFFNRYYKNRTYSYTDGVILNPNGSQYLPIIRPISSTYGADELGFIYMEMSTNTITVPLNTVSTYDNGNYFLNLCGHDYVYHDHILEPYNEEYKVIKDISAIASSPYTMVKEITGAAGNFIAVSVPLSATDCYLTKLITINSVYQQLLSILLIIVAFAFVTGIILHSILNRMINIPVRKLDVRMRNIADGHFQRDRSIEWDHELGEIGRGINDLAENVSTLIEQRICAENEKRDYEYKMLQSQINPHFLYNTLNSIQWMAVIQHAPGIAEMTTALSRLLKSIAKGTEKLVPLSAELSLLTDYFTIQKYRYGGTISLICQIEDEAALTCMIPRFTLQPIVENAIFHGIEPKGSPGTIVVHAFQKNDTVLQIDITDDGVGMTEKQVKELLSEKNNSKTDFFKEIGVSSVHKRLQYEYGSSYGLHVTSHLSEFTTVSILLPYEKKSL